MAQETTRKGPPQGAVFVPGAAFTPAAPSFTPTVTVQAAPKFANAVTIKAPTPGNTGLSPQKAAPAGLKNGE